MKNLFKLLTLIAIVMLTGCTTVEYRDKYTILTPEDNLMQDRHAPPPPATPKQYRMMTDKQRVELLEPYVSDLLVVIGQEHADKAGLRAYKAKAEAKIKELNDKASKQNGQ